MTKGALVGMVIGLVDQMGLWVISAQENWNTGGGGGREESIKMWVICSFMRNLKTNDMSCQRTR